jgi:hypothetical protein
MRDADYYNNGKIKIGSKYDLNPLKKKYIEEDPDMLEIQKYLICDPSILNRQYWTNRIIMTISCFVLLIVCIRGMS